MRCDEASPEPKLVTRKTLGKVKADVIDLQDHPMCLWLLMLSFMAGRYPRLKGRNTPIWHPPSFSSVVFSFNTLTLGGFTLNWRSLPVKRI